MLVNLVLVIRLSKIDPVVFKFLCCIDIAQAFKMNGELSIFKKVMVINQKYSKSKKYYCYIGHLH